MKCKLCYALLMVCVCVCVRLMCACVYTCNGVCVCVGVRVSWLTCISVSHPLLFFCLYSNLPWRSCHPCMNTFQAFREMISQRILQVKVSSVPLHNFFFLIINV